MGRDLRSAGTIGAVLGDGPPSGTEKDVMQGILSAAGYVPYRRLDRSAIAETFGSGGGRGTRAVAGYDEDTTTLGVEAARLALRAVPDTPAQVLWFSTVAPAYLDKTNATTIHAALRLDTDVVAADFGGAIRSGVAALGTALHTTTPTLVVTADIRDGLPTSADESAGGDAAAAILVGPDSAGPLIATLVGEGHTTEEFIDRWRVPGERRSKVWEERFGETKYVPLGEQAWNTALKDAELSPDQLDRVIVTGSHGRAVRALIARLGVDKARVVDDLSGSVGFTGAAHPGLLLTTALETAAPGQTIALVSLAAGADVLLNAKSVFGMPAMASSFFNIGSIVGGVVLGYWIEPHFGPRALLGRAVGTLIGGALQLAVQLPSLARLGYRFRPDFQWRDAGVSAILALMGPSVIAASTTQVNVLVNSVFASKLGDGPTFWLTVAFRLMQLPLGIFGVALGTVALPLLARMAATGNTAGFRSELARGMRLAFLMTIPASVGLMVLAEPIISVLYQHGRFGAHETAESAGALRFYAIGLCGYAALKVLVNAFYALDRRKTPMVVSFLAVGLNLLLNWIFTLQLGWGHRGLAFSTACVATSNFLILYVLMRRQLGTLESRAMLSLLGKIAVASSLLLGISWAGGHFLLADWAVQAFWPKLLSLMLVIAAGAGAFFFAASALGIGEVHDITRAVRRRLQRRA